MAPHSTYKKHVKFAHSRSPIPRKKSTSSANSYANIVLHYLSKLKGLFQSNRNQTHSISKHFTSGTNDNVYKPILKKDPRRKSRSEDDLESKRKAYDIVDAALQYGCDNNIIEKVGSYFLVRGKSGQRISTRRPTPGPDYVRCASCKNLTTYSKRRSVTELRSDDKISDTRGYYDDGHGSIKRRRSTSHSNVVNYCPKCYSRMKSNRKW